MTRTPLIEQKRALLNAVRVLTDHGHHVLAQQLWETTSALDNRKAVKS